MKTALIALCTAAVACMLCFLAAFLNEGDRVSQRKMNLAERRGEINNHEVQKLF
jgi:hypothetical protein